jgi:hypothetical protein
MLTSSNSTKARTHLARAGLEEATLRVNFWRILSFTLPSIQDPSKRSLRSHRSSPSDVCSSRRGRCMGL